MSEPAQCLPGSVLEEMLTRRGRAYAFETLPARRTALVAIDLTAMFFGTSEAERILAERINRLAEHLRASGGAVMWVRPAPFANGNVMRDLIGAARLELHAQAQSVGDPRNELSSLLDVRSDDLHTRKALFSAFFPGSSDAYPRLLARGIDHVLVCGLVTDVCVEASARDACSCGLRTVLVSDATIGTSPEAQTNTLIGFHRRFGDVRTVDQTLAILT